MPTIKADTPQADFNAQINEAPSTVILERRRRIVFKQGRDLNLFDVVQVNLNGSWWRIYTADGVMHLVNPAEVNYADIS